METFIYLDQNIISSIANKEIEVFVPHNYFFVYSNTHFEEIIRSNNPKKYIDALSKIDAKHIDVQMIGWELTGRTILDIKRTPYELFQEYQDAILGFENVEKKFDPLFAWINGGGTQEELLALKQLTPIHQEFNDALEQMVERGNNINDVRNIFGVKVVEINNLKPEVALKEIWSKVQHLYEGSNISEDQFWGFKPYDFQENAFTTLNQQISGCCAVLDIVGYKAEKKAKKIEQIPNVRSDSNHIGMSIDCHMLFSHDKRLIDRANAIFAYKSINTKAIHIDKSVKRLSICETNEA